MATTPKSKHERIFCELYDSIVAGEYATGQQIPTEAELALRFGASRPTVARALRDLEQRGYLLRRRGSDRSSPSETTRRRAFSES